MSYQVGDKVIHLSYGLGDIVSIEEKLVQGRPTNCYVFKNAEITVWIPTDQPGQTSLRAPTPPEEFGELFAILAGPGESLPEDRVMRKDQLRAQLRGGQLAQICHVIRNLLFHKSSAKLNDQETLILEQAKKSLLTEWAYSLNVPRFQAEQELLKILSS